MAIEESFKEILADFNLAPEIVSECKYESSFGIFTTYYKIIGRWECNYVFFREKSSVDVSYSHSGRVKIETKYNEWSQYGIGDPIKRTATEIYNTSFSENIELVQDGGTETGSFKKFLFPIPNVPSLLKEMIQSNLTINNFPWKRFDYNKLLEDSQSHLQLANDEMNKIVNEGELRGVDEIAIRKELYKGMIEDELYPNIEADILKKIKPRGSFKDLDYDYAIPHFKEEQSTIDWLITSFTYNDKYYYIVIDKETGEMNLSSMPTNTQAKEKKGFFGSLFG